MRTYLLDSFNKYKRFSETLDVRTILCNKSWWIFNDCEEKEIYIFQEDGSLIISFDGKVTRATWQYIPANKSLIISSKDEAYMLHPAFSNENIFALQQDGTNKYAFMIDEQQGQSFQPKSLTELKLYFENIECKKIKAEQKRQKQIEQSRIEQERKEKERERLAKKEKEQIKKEIEQEEILEQSTIYNIFKLLGVIIICSPIYFPINLCITDNTTIFEQIAGGIFIFISLVLGMGYKIIMDNLKKYLISKYYKTHRMSGEKFKNGGTLRTQINNEKKQSKKVKRVEKRKQEREIRIKKEIDNNKRKIEERRKKEKEWEEERKIWLKKEALDIQSKLNSNEYARELAEQISLSIEYITTQSNNNGLNFRVDWKCPDYRYKEISLIINNGEDVLLYEHLVVSSSQTIEIKEVKSTIRITLRLVCPDTPIYKIILI